MAAMEVDGDPSDRVKLRDVASVAHVSVSTVSKVLNGRSGVSKDTRLRIEALLSEGKYNRRASSQVGSRLVEVLCFEIDSPFASEVISSIERVAGERGVGIVLTGATAQHVPPNNWTETVLARWPVGVILVASQLPTEDRHRLQSHDIPIVMVDPSGAPAADVPSIGSADWNGGFLATNHLIELGHVAIAIITGPDDMLASTARLSGYRAALDAAGIPVLPEWVRPGQFHHADGVVEGRAVLALDPRPTAVFASSDLQALGVYEAARSLGLDIPGDLSVIGYDDLKIAKWAGPPLTTIRVPLVEMAEQATRLVMRLRDEPELAFSRVDLATSLVVRGSTARPGRR